MSKLRSVWVAMALVGCGEPESAQPAEDPKSVSEEMRDVGQALEADRKALSDRLDRVGEKVDARLEQLGDDAEETSREALEDLSARIEKARQDVRDASQSVAGEVSDSVETIEKDVAAMFEEDTTEGDQEEAH